MDAGPQSASALWQTRAFATGRVQLPPVREMINANTANQIQFVDRYREEK